MTAREYIWEKIKKKMIDEVADTAGRKAEDSIDRIDSSNIRDLMHYGNIIALTRKFKIIRDHLRFGERNFDFDTITDQKEVEEVKKVLRKSISKYLERE